MLASLFITRNEDRHETQPTPACLPAPQNDGGVYKKILVEGEGEEDDTPPTGAKVTVHYTGVLQATGQVFDSSRHANPKAQHPSASCCLGPLILVLLLVYEGCK